MPRYSYTPPKAESSEDAETVHFEDMRGLLRDVAETDKAERRVTENVADFDTFEQPRHRRPQAASAAVPGAFTRAHPLRETEAYAVLSPTPAPLSRRLPVVTPAPLTWWQQVLAYLGGFVWSVPAKRRPSLQ